MITGTQFLLAALILAALAYGHTFIAYARARYRLYRKEKKKKSSNSDIFNWLLLTTNIGVSMMLFLFPARSLLQYGAGYSFGKFIFSMLLFAFLTAIFCRKKWKTQEELGERQ